MLGLGLGLYTSTKDAPTKPREEEFVFGMGQSKLLKFVVMKDAPIKSRNEDFAFGMGQSSNATITKDAPTFPGKEEFVFGTGQSHCRWLDISCCPAPASKTDLVVFLQYFVGKLCIIISIHNYVNRLRKVMHAIILSVDIFDLAKAS